MKRIIALFISMCCMLLITSCSAENTSNSDAVDNSDTDIDSSYTAAASEITTQDNEVPGTAAGSEISATERNTEMIIKVTDGTNCVVFKLNDGSAAKSLYEQLPLTVEVQDYGSNEKIFYPPWELDTSDVIEEGGSAGMLAYFSPWGNVVMYYDRFSSYPGLYILGEATENAGSIEKLSGEITITAE